ncbi:UNVERIFIED_CONTAM: hypothetical protein Sradi_2402200 [Sesamum radiatum]|uniref:Uncharacterized protein n=1 Tax=Sesamum radiatum TaxID=300843 RepID=A0AAW2SH78_SESRA
MSVAKSVIAFGYPRGLDIIKPRRPSQTPIIFISSANLPMVRKHHSLFFKKQGFKRLNNLMRVQKTRYVAKEKILFLACALLACFFQNNTVGTWSCTVLFNLQEPRRLLTLLSISYEVDTAVETIEVIVDAVEKVAEEVEKAAEHIANDLPEGGTLRKAVDFVETVAEVTSKEAHLVGDFIDKVQEAEEKVEACVESMAEEVVHPHPRKEDRADEQIEELNKN